MERLDGKSVAVIGLGVSGVAAARLAFAKGGDVYVSDSSTQASTAARAADLRSSGIAVELGGHDLDRVARAGIVVVSPGIPPDAPVLRALRERGVRWISEPELAVRFYSGQLIAVTGTNGKTTTTLLITHLLREAGMRAAAGGNVGGGLAPTASDLALLDEVPDWYVLEMSSFQLAGVETFRPDVGVVTNLSPDHLDYYPDVEAYFADKARLFANAEPGSQWVLPVGDEAVAELAGEAPGERHFFGGSRESGSEAWVEDDALWVEIGAAAELLLDVADFPLLGAHNVSNALAAALVASLAGVSAEDLGRGLASARPLPHRMEPVAETAGVLWVNDSKATNVAASVSALRSADRPVVLLLGGKDKGEAFAPLAAEIPGRVRRVLAYGAAGERIAREVGDATVVELLGSDFRAVVSRADEVAEDGDMVLLSPACSSYDMFESYEDRGRAFASLIEELA
ncbi:MAG: UDP-N-acetylmuramoyl-L-alanine--D-glutamate ligase [Gemmatimonadota bacterium]|jgi:UDP-N-acetylmuramoylalanine--D-glutamate ligase